MTAEQLQNMKEEYLRLLRSTGRTGIESVIGYLEKNDFFNAPASTVFHGNYPGGLMEHSLNVCRMGLKLREMMIAEDASLEEKLKPESVILVSLLHDVNKADIYKTAVKSRKKPDGYWEKYNGYEVDYSHLPLGHGEKSVIVLLVYGLKLTTSEILAIRWHMGAWDLPFQSSEITRCNSVAKEQYPLCTLLQAADGLSASILEKTVTPEAIPGSR